MNPLSRHQRASGGRDRPVERLAMVSTPARSDGSEAAAEATRRWEKHERIEADRDRMAADVRHRPEDSSPAIRRLLGYDAPPRPPRRWEARVEWGQDGLRLRSVDAGPADPAGGDASRRGGSRG